MSCICPIHCYFTASSTFFLVVAGNTAAKVWRKYYHASLVSRCSVLEEGLVVSAKSVHQGPRQPYQQLVDMCLRSLSYTLLHFKRLQFCFPLSRPDSQEPRTPILEVYGMLYVFATRVSPHHVDSWKVMFYLGIRLCAGCWSYCLVRCKMLRSSVA